MSTTFPESILPKVKCPHCGEQFTKLKDQKIPSHSWPKLTRAVCPGAGSEPKLQDDTPLWKDDPEQRSRDFFEKARTEFLILGFAVVKEMALLSRKRNGETKCPLCGKQVRFHIAHNSHCGAICETEGCIKARE